MRPSAQSSTISRALDHDDIPPLTDKEAARRADALWVRSEALPAGLTEAKSAEPVAKSAEAWHEAYGTLVVHVHAEYDDKNDETHALIRERLLSPYENTAEEEQRAEQRARSAARKKVGQTPT